MTAEQYIGHAVEIIGSSTRESRDIGTYLVEQAPGILRRI